MFNRVGECAHRRSDSDSPLSRDAVALDPGGHGAVDSVRPLRPEVLDRDRGEDRRQSVIGPRRRSQRSVDVSGDRPDVSEEARRAVSYTHLTLPTIYSV